MGVANGIVFFPPPFFPFLFQDWVSARVWGGRGEGKGEEEKYCRDQFTVVRVRCLSSLF